MSRPSRGETAGEDEEARQQESHQHKSQARRQLTSVREQVEIKQAELAALAAEAEELTVKVEGKPNVYDQLEADRESRGRPKKKAVSPAAGTVCWRQLQTTRHHTSGGLVPAAASASGSAAASASDEVVKVFEYEGKEYIRADLAEQMSVPKEKSER